MSLLLNRYCTEEPAQVWQEAAELWGESDSGSPDAAKVASEAMSRVARNLRIIVEALAEASYEFESATPIASLSEEDKRLISRFVREIGGIPLTLREFWDQIGSVNLCQNSEVIHAAKDPQMEWGVLDPLFVSSPSQVLSPIFEAIEEEAKRGVSQVPFWRKHEEEVSTDRSFDCWFANDEFHKANFSGGENYHYILPNDGFDFPISGWFGSEQGEELTQEWFIEHLRLACQGCGFRGRSSECDETQTLVKRPPKIPELHELSGRLEAF